MSWQPWRGDDGWRGGRRQSRDRPYGGKGYSGGGGHSGSGGHGGGYGPYDGGSYEAAERPWQTYSRGKGDWHDVGRGKGQTKGGERVSVSDALNRIRGAVEEQRQIAQVARLFGPGGPAATMGPMDSQLAWGTSPYSMGLLGPPPEAPLHGTSLAAGVAEPLSQVARMLMTVGSSAGAVAAQSLAGMVGRAVRGILAEAPPLLRILGPARDQPPLRSEGHAGDSLTSRIAAAEDARAHEGAPPDRDVSEALMHQLLREVGSLRAETARLRRERDSDHVGDADPAIADAPEAARRPAHVGSVTAPPRPVDEGHVQRILAAALTSPSHRAATSPEPDAQPAEDAVEEFMVSPTLHRAFFQWLGASGSIRQDMKVSKWAEAMSKRWALKEWRSRTKDAGVDIARMPTSLKPLVAALLDEYRAAPGAVRSTATRS